MSDQRWLDDSQQLAWRALGVIVNRGLPELERTFRDNEMLMVEYGILAALSEAPDTEMRLSDLADLSNTSPSRLTHRMRRLRDHGDVEVRDCSTDGRVTYARLTAAGRRRLMSVAPQHADDVQCLLFDHLDTDQTRALADTLSTVAATLCNHDYFRPPSDDN